MRPIFAAALFLAACATAPQTRVSPDPVIAAERAFAARAGEIGWIPAFREFMAGDSNVISRGAIVSAPERFAALQDDGERTLYWRPTWAGIARSGDLGFTTGPVFVSHIRQFTGHYFTVWRRQADGGWRWIFDGGASVVEGQVADERPPLATAARGEGSAEAAVAAVRALEIQIAAGGARDAIAARLGEDSRVDRAGVAFAHGQSAGRALLAADAASLAYEPPTRIEASQAGDLTFTLGAVRWVAADGAPRRGHYARIWQRQPAGWRIVFDEILPSPQV